MEIELLTSRSGPGGAQNRGDKITVSDDEGTRLIKAGQAIPVRDQKVEKAVKRGKAERADK